MKKGTGIGAASFNIVTDDASDSVVIEGDTYSVGVLLMSTEALAALAFFKLQLDCDSMGIWHCWQEGRYAQCAVNPMLAIIEYCDAALGDWREQMEAAASEAREEIH